MTFCECYQRSPIYYDGSEQSAHWQRAGVDILVVTSGEMLQQIYTLVPDYYRSSWLLRCRLIVVSDRLAALATQMGWTEVRVAENADNDALIRALQDLNKPKPDLWDAQYDGTKYPIRTSGRANHCG